MLCAWTGTGTSPFPVDARALALGPASRLFPTEPIARVEEADIPGVEGALLRLRGGKGWAIAYNGEGRSAGRVNFTIAHELGHYAMHRALLPDGVRCLEGDIAGDAARLTAIEREANAFATGLLIPIADLRRRISPDAEPGREQLLACVDRYGVSLTTLALRWLSLTDRAAMVVLVREGFVVWARSSKAALRRGWFVSTAGAPVPCPAGSTIAMNAARGAGEPWAISAWFGVPARHMAFRSERHDFTLSLMLLADRE